MAAAANIDIYISSFPPATRKALEAIRGAIRKAAPDALETISYAIPCFKLNGRALIFFAGYAAHVGIYPIPKGNVALLKEMLPYIAGKGTLRFALNEKLPMPLIRKVITQHVIALRERQAR